MTTSGITFPARNAEAFVRELKQEVDQYFKSRGISTKANAGMVIKTALLVLLTFGSYGLVLALNPPFGPCWA